MYIYFEQLNCVVTCQEFPQIISVEEMELNSLQNVCNKWEKQDNPSGSFKLYYQYYGHEYYNKLYQIYNRNEYLYLHHSYNENILSVKPMNRFTTFCNLCEHEGYPNIYKWVCNSTFIFPLHIKDGKLSDCCVSNIKDIQDSCYIIFTEYIRAPTEFILT